MKTIFMSICVMLTCIMLVNLPVFAETGEGLDGINDTSRGQYDTAIPALTNWLNTTDDFKHTHEVYIDERRTPAGVGLDIVAYQSEGVFEALTIEGKYDVANDEGSAYLVGRVNLFKPVKAWLSK